MRFIDTVIDKPRFALSSLLAVLLVVGAAVASSFTPPIGKSAC